MSFLGIADTPHSSNPSYLINFWREVDEIIKKNLKNSFLAKALAIAKRIESPEQGDELKKHFKECEWNWDDWLIDV